MKITALDHVQLAMPAGEEAAARRFYGEVLGLREIGKPAVLARRGGCWFAGDGVVVHLGVEAEFSPARKAHPAFRVDDLAAWRDHLAAAGELVIPDDSVPSVRRCFTADPFGNRIEFMQAGDTFPADE